MQTLDSDRRIMVITRALPLAALGLAALTLSARALDYRVYFFAWAYVFAATVFSLALSVILAGATRHRLLPTILISYLVFGIAGLAGAALSLVLWQPGVEAPGFIFVPPFVFAFTNLMLWPLGARAFLRTDWAVAVATGLIVAAVMPIVIAVGMLIAGTTWYIH